MDVSAADVVGELKVLRKGRGVFTTPLGDRVGPTLRGIWGISDAADQASVRHMLVSRLLSLAEALPEDARTVLLAAFALEERARMPLYQERVRWAASMLDRDERTVRRRIDEAIEQLAALAA